jgi:hypothetical protein
LEKKKKRTLVTRLCNKIRYELWDLFTTTDTLEDKTIIEAPKYFSDFNILLLGIFKRLVFVGLFFYFAITIYRNTTQKQQFVGADLNSGNCQSIVKLTNGNRYADINGYWKGHQNYTNSLAIYLFEFQVGRNLLPFLLIIWLNISPKITI